MFLFQPAYGRWLNQLPHLNEKNLRCMLDVQNVYLVQFNLTISS